MTASAKSTVVALLALLIPFSNAFAKKPERTVCEKTAATMKQSCIFEINEEYKATIANCMNISERDDRRECRTEAAATRHEDRELCREVKWARIDVCNLLSEDRYDPDPLTGVSTTGEVIEFVDPDSIGVTTLPNPYLSLVAGQTQVLRAGEDFEETIVVHVTNEVREIRGVLCRTVVDIVLLKEDDEYVAVEVTDDWFAQSTTGDVYYCGEVARNYEDGVLVDLDGSFEAGRDFAKAGVLIKAAPTAGDAHRQEFLLGEAEDVIRYVSTMAAPPEEEGGENLNFPCAPMGCVKTEEFIPTEPESGEYKYFLAGTGFVLGVALEDGEITEERDELVCAGSSLHILSQAGCGLSDPEELLETLCQLSPTAFCEDD